MKFTDKFVLVPIERYDRMLDTPPSSRNEEKEVKKLQSGEGIDNKISIKEEDKTTGGAEYKDQEKNEDKYNVDKEKDSTSDLNAITNSLKDNKIFVPSIKRRKKLKLSQPPPGIPNKIKKSDFRWISLKNLKEKNKNK